MSGRKQHYIPQAVQRGFAIAVSKKVPQVYVFRKGRTPYPSAIADVGAERDFYSAPSTHETLDDRITRYEGAVLGPAVAALRESEPGPVDSHAAASAVVHLSVRSAFVRGSISTGASQLLSQLLEALSSEERSRKLLGVDSVNSESTIFKSLEEELRNRIPAGTPDGERDFFAKLVRFRAREKFAQMHARLAGTAQILVQNLLDRLPESMVSGHNKSLQQELVPPLRVQRLEAMKWTVVSAPSGTHFVLPDCLALGSKTADFREMAPYALLADNELAGVVMPVSATKVVVGCSGVPQLDPAQLNEAFARSSQSFFISSQNDAPTRALVGLIGNSVASFIAEVASELAFAPPPQSSAPASARSTTSRSKVLVRFEPAARKSGKVHAVVRNLLDAPQLQDGMDIVEFVVVCDDVAGALRQRGLQLNELAAQTVTFGTCHVIDSAEQTRCQLFLPAKVVDAVLRGTDPTGGAAALIRHQAGRATYFANLINRVPKELLRRPMPLIEKVASRIAHAFASHYFGARLSLEAELSESQLSATRTFWRQAAISGMQEMQRARLHFLEHADANASLAHALTHAELFLTASASACAASTRQVEQLVVGPESLPAIHESSLQDWLPLFARDLERCFSSRDYWTTDEELRLLASHVERILWSFGVVLSDNGPDSVVFNSLSEDKLTVVRAALKE